MTRISYRCPKCGGDCVGKDALAVWNDATQTFADPICYDQNLCNDCGEIGEMDEIVLPDLRAPAKKTLVLDLSTAHLTAEVCQGVSDHVIDLPASVKSDEYGFFMSCYAAHEPDKMTKFPQCLQDCLNRAVAEGCDYILFDRDAPQLDGLPSYDW